MPKKNLANGEVDHDHDRITKLMGSALCGRVLEKKKDMNVPIIIKRRQTVTDRGHVIEGDLEV